MLEKIENSFFFRLEPLMIMSANSSLMEPSETYFSQTRVFPMSLRFRTLNLPSTFDFAMVKSIMATKNVERLQMLPFLSSSQNQFHFVLSRENKIFSSH